MRTMTVGFGFSKGKSQVLLLIKNKPKWMKGLLNGIGGGVESVDDSYKDTMSREFFEETGVGIKSFRWNHFLTLTPKDAVIFFYSATLAYEEMLWAVENTQDKDEKCIIVMLDELSKLKDNVDIMQNLKWLIPLALDNTVPKPVLINSMEIFKR